MCSRSLSVRLVRGACSYDPARVVSAGKLVDDVGDERPDDGNGVGDTAAGARGVDDERARVRSHRDADEAS